MKQQWAKEGWVARYPALNSVIELIYRDADAATGVRVADRIRVHASGRKFLRHGDPRPVNWPDAVLDHQSPSAFQKPQQILKSLCHIP